MNFRSYFTALGFSENESRVYEDLIGKQGRPASAISTSVGLDRTTVYKILMRFTQEGIVHEDTSNRVKNFGISSLQDLYRYVNLKSRSYQSLEGKFEQVIREFEQESDQMNFQIVHWDDISQDVQIYTDDLWGCQDARVQKILDLMQGRQVTRVGYQYDTIYIVFDDNMEAVVSMSWISLEQK